MNRVVSLWIVLAHVCVVSMPCFEAELDPDALLRLAASAPRAERSHAQAHASHTGPTPSPSPVEPIAQHDAHAHHAPTPEPIARHDAHAHHAHHAATPTPTPTPGATPMDAHAHHHEDAAPSEHAAPPPSKPKQAMLELRAKCTCGCSQDADRPGSTTSSRVGFALLSAPTERLLELPPPFDVWSIERAPASRADTFDHVPILS